MINFNNLNIQAELLSQLNKNNFVKPTEIQNKVIPIALSGVDILASAETGSGKTMAFLIPLISILLNKPSETALIMVPTRELAVQVVSVAMKLIPNNGKIKVAQLIGGESMLQQLKQLSKNPKLIVGTPGRIYDHIQRKSFNPESVKFLVLDETDRMLSLGFEEQLAEISKFLPKEKQTLMFSATVTKNIMSMVKKYLNEYERIEVGNNSKPAQNISQDVIYTSEDKKFETLTFQLDEREGSIIVFVKTKVRADSIANKLNEMNYIAKAIHGDLSQHQRFRVIEKFRKQNYRILIATDVAARGLDIDHIKHVINYDLPQCPEDYIHRIGRTARGAGTTGNALCLVAKDEMSKWHAINKFINPDFIVPYTPRSKEQSKRKKFFDKKAGLFGSKTRADQKLSNSSSRKNILGDRNLNVKRFVRKKVGNIA